jgi:hypothetical protein
MRRPPYAPFLSGAPEFLVGLKPIEPARWIAPDIEAQCVDEKRALIAARRAEVYRAVAGAKGAEVEVEELVRGVVGGAAPHDDSALVRASQLVSDDLVVMQREGSEWRAASAVLCSPTFFSAEHAVGKTLLELHGPVPDRLGPGGVQGMSARIARVFAGLQPDMVLERFNWTVQAGPDRFTPDGAPLRARAAAAETSEALDLLHLRVERQTIRALPKSGAVLFTIRISLDPLRAVFAEPGARDGFAAAWEHARPHVRAYKKWDAYERLVRAALA